MTFHASPSKFLFGNVVAVAAFICCSIIVSGGETSEGRAEVSTSGSDTATVAPAFPPREIPVERTASPEVIARQGRSPGMIARRGAFASVQVNVDAFGNNIIGDAANEPSMAIDPTNPSKIAIGWRQFDSIADSFRQAGLSYSGDGGKSWTFPGVLDPGQFRSDPVLGSDSAGNFYYSSLSSLSSIEVFKSSNGGMTWGVPVPAFGGDKQWIAIDDTAGIGSGNVYQIWNVQFTCCGNNDFTRSTDGGASFQGPFAIPQPSMKWGTMDVGPDGTLYLAGTTLDLTGHIFSYSTNAQNPAQVPVFDLVQNVNLGGTGSVAAGPNPGGLLGQTWIATDHSAGATAGNLYILQSVNPPGSDPLDIHFIRSEDNGASWSAPVRVNDDLIANNAWQWFGTMSVAPNGRIDVVWNDTRNTGQDNLSELFYSFSNDGGLTWSLNTPVSPVFDSFLGWPQQNKIGDYYHMVSDNEGADLAWAATFNGEQDVYFLRIAIDCNNNGILDICDVDCGPLLGECDVPGCGGSSDTNGNRIPDECDSLGCTVGPPPTPELVDGDVNANSRMLSFSIPDTNRLSIRVIFDSLPSPYDIWNGFELWVGPTSEVSENGANVEPIPGFDTFSAAQLQDTFFQQATWFEDGVISVFHEGIVPGGRYIIQTIREFCFLENEGSYSAHLIINNAKWGDTVGNCETVPCSVPDTLNNIIDVLAVVARFVSDPDAILKHRADLEPRCLDLVLNITDVNQAVNAFVGLTYPFTPSAPNAFDSKCSNPLP